MTSSRRALVTLPDGIWTVIDTKLKGKLGDGDSEVIRTLIIAYLTEKGYLLPSEKQPSQVMEIADEVEMLDTMVNSLVEVMEERGQIRYSDWEARLKKKIAERTKKTQKP